MSPEKLIKAFDTTGQYIQDPIDVPGSFGFLNNKSTVDYKRIIGLCTTQISDESLSNFESAVSTSFVAYRGVGRNLSSTMDNVISIAFPISNFFNSRFCSIRHSINPGHKLSHTILRLSDVILRLLQLPQKNRKGFMEWL